MGRPVEQIVAATVVAANSADADALATALNVLTVGEGLALARSSGAECLLVTADGKVERSAGFGRYERGPVVLAAAAAANQEPAKGQQAGGTWNNDYELVVNFELNSASASRGFRRQYVAIWVEDKDGFPVRTLLLWGKGRWVTDLKLWTQGDQERRLVDEADLRATVSRPTRPPGKYDVILGRQGRPRQTRRRRRLHGLHRGGARARDVPEHPQASDAGRAAVRRGTQGKCRDQIRLDRVSPQGSGQVARRAAVPARARAGPGGGS